MTNLGSILESRKVCIVKSTVFPVVIYRCVSWTIKKAERPKNGCFWIVVLKKTLESPLESKEIKPIHLKGNQPWKLIGRADAEAEVPIFWPPDMKSLLIWKDPDSGKDWGQKEKWATEDEMFEWHHRLNGDAFEQIPGDSGGQGGLACCRPWGRKESYTTYPTKQWVVIVGGNAN